MGILLNDLEKLICKNEITIALRKTQVKPLALIRSEKSSHINHVAIQEDTKDPRGSSGDVAGGRTRGTLFQKEYVHFPCGGVPWKFGRKTLGKHVFSYHHLWRSHSCFGSALSPITVATNTPSCLMAWWRKKKRRVPGLAWDAEGSKRQTHGVVSPHCWTNVLSAVPVTFGKVGMAKMFAWWRSTGGSLRAWIS